MAWNKAMRAWASEGPERKRRGDIYRDGWMRITTRCGGWSHTRIYYVTAAEHRLAEKVIDAATGGLLWAGALRGRGRAILRRVRRLGRRLGT